MSEAGSDPFDTTRMSLAEHLDELRSRLMKGLGAVALAFLVGWAFRHDISDVVQLPMHRALDRIDVVQVDKYEEKLAADPELVRTDFFLSDDPEDRRLLPELTVSGRMIATSAQEPFLFLLKISGYFALVIGSPVLIYQLWQFVAAGLYVKERRMVGRSVPISLALFASGVVFGYFIAVPYGLYFLITAFPPEQMQFLASMSEYLSLLTLLTLALGFVFQLPLIMNVLVRTDLVPRSTFAGHRRHFIVGAVILAAMLTPPDPYTQLMLAVPMMILFEVGLLWTRFYSGADGPAEEAA